jgi:hypothetical protein
MEVTLDHQTNYSANSIIDNQSGVGTVSGRLAGITFLRYLLLLSHFFAGTLLVHKITW